MTTTIPLLDLRRERAQIAAELQREWDGVLDGMQLLRGRQRQLFESEIAEFIGVAHAVGVGSGSDALLIGLAALGLGRGDRVILPANAFVAALSAVHHFDAVPVLVDVADDGFGPDVTAIEHALPARAVIVVHLYGHVVPLERLRRSCDAHGAGLVEDGSHAHGATRAGRRVGSFGALGCFSAGVVKNLAAYGDAGFIATNDTALATQIRLLQEHGQAQKNVHLRYGYNSRLDELQATVLRIKLRRLDARNERRRAIARFYDERFRPLELQLPPSDADEVPVYHQYILRLGDRDAFREYLRGRGIETGVHYPTPLHRQPAWYETYGTDLSLPRAERLGREVVSVPVFPELTDAEVETVASTVESYVRSRPQPRATVSNSNTQLVGSGASS